MKRMTALLAGVALMLTTASAMALTLDPYNERQVTIGASYPGEDSLQTELDRLFGAGAVDADTDQLSVGMFKVSTPGSNLIAPQFKFEWTANDTNQGVGIFGWDGTQAKKALIFGGVHNIGDYANVLWTTQNSGFIQTVDIANPFAPTISTFSGIDRNFFGFYFQPTTGIDPTYFSVDALNPTGSIQNPVQNARVLAYDGSAAGIANSGIVFAYEDGTDFDYNDAGFFVESITAVPEPGTMLLLGAGFLGLAIYGKRRKNA